MSREILFRGKRTDNGKWAEGDLIAHKRWSNVRAFIGQRIGGNYIETEVDMSTVCQYTDRNDCKGRKIFEGDIIDNYNHTHNMHMKGVVKFGEYSMPTDAYRIRKGTHLGFYIYWIDEDMRDTYRCDFAWYAYAIEVVGNVFDTPELLEGGTSEDD